MERSSHPCKRLTLAKNGLVTVESCDCGVVHLTLKALTMRFDPGALRSLRDALDEAVRAMSSPKREPRWVMDQRRPRGSA